MADRDLPESAGTPCCAGVPLHESVLRRAIKEAARRAGLAKAVNCHTRRHSFATHRLEDGYDMRTIQAWLGHRDVSTTMISTHVLNRGGRGVHSPVDHRREETAIWWCEAARFAVERGSVGA